jgi:HD-GYP domain-containing protein (c-di-GMP phosphodiesterase class II)
LAGEDIPLQARILAVADSFDAMTSQRPYRAGRGIREAMGEVTLCTGTQFDPAIVAAFLESSAEVEETLLAARALFPNSHMGPNIVH